MAPNNQESTRTSASHQSRIAETTNPSPSMWPPVHSPPLGEQFREYARAIDFEQGALTGITTLAAAEVDDLTTCLGIPAIRESEFQARRSHRHHCIEKTQKSMIPPHASGSRP